jgi:hypothetical protein
MKTYFWSGERPNLMLDLTKRQILMVAHSGDCLDDVLALLPELSEQTDYWPDEELRQQLSEYGAWSNNELNDHAANIRRMVWIVCCNLKEEYQLK